MILTFSFVSGLAIGSFINALVYRMHTRGKNIMTGRSACPHCHHTLAAIDLIPLVSFLMLQGKCRYCGKSISLHYPFVEILTGVCFLLIVRAALTAPLTHAVIGTVVLWLVYTSILITVATYDALYGEIPDRIMFPAIFIALVSLPLPFTPSIASGVIGALIPTVFFSSLILISQGRWMGGGDVRLGAFMGLILGWPTVLVALGCAYVTGSIVAITLLGSGTLHRGNRMPFGPFLVLGTFFAILVGDRIIAWYLSFLF